MRKHLTSPRGLSLIATCVCAALGYGSDCFGGEEDPCPNVAVDPAVVAEGSAAFTYGEQDFEMSLADDATETAPCSFMVLDTTIYEPDDASDVPRFRAGVLLQCHLGTDLGFNAWIDDLGNPLEWTPGTETLAGLEAGCFRWYPGSSPACEHTLHDLAVVLSVEEVTGGPAPWPAVVSPDFRLVFSLDYQYSEPDSVDCPDLLDATVSVRAVIDASHFTVRPCGA
jgi:hypothetical protein